MSAAIPIVNPSNAIPSAPGTGNAGVSPDYMRGDAVIPTDATREAAGTAAVAVGAHAALTTGVHGLGSAAGHAAADFELAANKGQASGYAGLDGAGSLAANNLTAVSGLGPNLITGATAWTASPSSGLWTASGTTVTANGTGSGGNSVQPSTPIVPVQGQTYLISFTVSAITGTCSYIFSGVTIALSAGNYSALIQASGTTNNLRFVAGDSGAQNFTISNINVQLVTNGQLFCQQIGIDTATPAASLDVGGFGTLLTGLNAKAVIAENYPGISGMQMVNQSSATNADFRFVLTDNAKGAYLAFFMPSTTNVSALFGQLRNAICGLFTNVVGGVARMLVLGTVSATDLILGTNNTERMRITSGGSAGLGVSSPTAVLQLKAGTATAGTAPIKLTTTGAVLLTTPEPGAMETDGAHLYWTDASGARHTIV